MSSYKNKLFWEKRKPNMQSMVLSDYFSKLVKEEKTEIISYLPNIKSKTILELGAGIGRFTNYFANYANHITVVDFIKRFIEENKKEIKTFKISNMFAQMSWTCLLKRMSMISSL